MLHPSGRIDRYLAGDLDPEAAAKLRAHVAGCVKCRARFDEQVTFLRALAGNRTRPAPSEEARMVRRALEGAGPAPARPKRGLFEWLVDHPFAAAAAAAAVLLLLLGGGLFMMRGPAPAGRLVVASHVTLDGRAVEAGAPVPAGASLHVDEKGLAEVELARGGRVKVYPGATLRFDARGENVDLGLGRVWSSVEGGRGGYSVRTDRAVARVLGTSFVVERTVEGETDVRVIKGTVEVEDRQRRGKVRVNASQRTRVGRSGAPSAPRHYSSEGDLNDWERFFRDIGRAFERLFKGQ